MDYFKRKAKKSGAGKAEPAIKKKPKVTYTLGGTDFEGIEKVKSKARTIMNLKENGQTLNAKEHGFVSFEIYIVTRYSEAPFSVLRESERSGALLGRQPSGV